MWPRGSAKQAERMSDLTLLVVVVAVAMITVRSNIARAILSGAVAYLLLPGVKSI